MWISLFLWKAVKKHAASRSCVYFLPSLWFEAVTSCWSHDSWCKKECFPLRFCELNQFWFSSPKMSTSKCLRLKETRGVFFYHYHASTKMIYFCNVKLFNWNSAPHHQISTLGSTTSLSVQQNPGRSFRPLRLLPSVAVATQVSMLHSCGVRGHVVCMQRPSDVATRVVNYLPLTGSSRVEILLAL